MMDQKCKLPFVGENLPRNKNRFLPIIGKLMLMIFRWGFINDVPNVKKCVIVIGPHTSNWDFVFGLSGLLATGIKASWMGKHSIFKLPFRRMLRWVGGIPIERSASSGVVDSMVNRFKTSEKFVLALAPEGTRSKVDQWKTGFYHIAMGAHVPIFMVSLDYKDKAIILGPLFDPTGNVEADIEKMQAVFSQVQAKKTDKTIEFAN